MEIEERAVQEKTLYVCVNNVGRSQMAEAFHNDIIPDTAESAGIAVDKPGGKVADWIGGADYICQSMDELNLDISKNTRTQFDVEMAKKFGRTVFLLQTDQVPECLFDILDEKRLWWPMDDPRDITLERTREIRDKIREDVEYLISKTVVVSEVP